MGEPPDMPCESRSGLLWPVLWTGLVCAFADALLNTPEAPGAARAFASTACVSVLMSAVAAIVLITVRGALRLTGAAGGSSSGNSPDMAVAVTLTVFFALFSSRRYLDLRASILSPDADLLNITCDLGLGVFAGLTYYGCLSCGKDGRGAGGRVGKTVRTLTESAPLVLPLIYPLYVVRLGMPTFSAAFLARAIFTAAAVAAVVMISIRRGPVFRERVAAVLFGVLLAAGAGGYRAVIPPEGNSARAVAGKMAPQADTPTIRHVILITIDTLRADHLSCYGSTTRATPNLDSLARDGVRYAEARSAASWTLPSLASIHSGLSVPAHASSVWGDRLPESLPTLARSLKGAGYATARAVGYNPAIQSHPGLSAGFDRYDMLENRRRGFRGPSVGERILGCGGVPEADMYNSTPKVTEAALEMIGEAGAGSAFLWIHYLDPHTPYTPAIEALPPPPAGSRVREMFDIPQALRVQSGGDVYDSLEIERVRLLYGAEVDYVDAHVGRLLDALREAGLYEDALIVMTSDHGEELWDHGRHGHGHDFHEEILRVPLIIKPPAGREGFAPGSVITRAVTNVAVHPTILEMCGVGFDPGGASSPPLPLSEDAGTNSDHSAVVHSGAAYFENRFVIYLDDARYKYIADASLRGLRLFDLDEDPGEERPLINLRPELWARADRTLRERLEADAKLLERYAPAQPAGNAPRTAEQEERLRALGYL